MAQKESCIAHEKSGTYVKIRESYLNLCIYMVKSAKREPTIKRNDCAAALLAYYEHRHNALLAVQQDKKVTPDDMFMESSMSFIERGMMYLYSQNSIREANDMLERRGFITTRVRRNPDNSKLFLPTEVRFNPDRVNEVLPLLKIEPTSKLNKVSYFKNEVPLLQFYREELYSINNTIINNKVSVVTDTPPLKTSESKTNLSEIPTGSGKTQNLDSVNSEKKQNEKPNSGGVGENVGNFVEKPAKPKKPVREWFKLSSLTDEQKGKIRELARVFDSPGDFGEALRQWLEYKEAGEINFRNQKINPYKNFDTMLKEVTSEANKCKGQSEVFKQAVQHSIDKLYLGLFPEKFITQSQTVKNGTYNNKNQPNSKREYATGI